MKILAIRGKNLASLEDEFEIDFTTEPLLSAGIFAITGSTGAGKSTILDALCLALYDNAPRLNKAESTIKVYDVQDKTISLRDSRNILRRGAAEGFAEVDFMALNGDKYRSRWMVRRAKGKINGTLQNTEISLINLTTTSEEQGTKKELLAKIVIYVGLTFDQFTRAVLLAQGEFATFLKADQKEKAELLEKLTGTEVYSQISIHIFQKTKEADKDLEIIQQRIQDIKLLTDEELDSLSQQRENLTKEVEPLKKTLLDIEKKLNWIKQEEQLKESIKKADENLIQINQTIEKEKARYGYIEKVDAAQEIRDIYFESLAEFKQFKSLKTILEEKEKENNSLKEELQKAEEQMQTARLKLEKQEQEYIQIKPDIEKAKELDIQYKEIKTKVEEANNEYLISKKQKEELQKNIQELQEQSTKLISKTNELSGWFQDNVKYTHIIPRVELIISLLTDAQTAKEQAARATVNLTSGKELITTYIAELKHLKEEALKLQTILSTEILTIRQRLEEGKPCPVCGSKAHPYHNQIQQSTVDEKQLESAKQKAETLIATIKTKIENKQTEITQLETHITNYRSLHTDTIEKLNTYLEQIPDWKKQFEKGDFLSTINNVASLWNTNKKELDTYSQQQESLVIKSESANKNKVTIDEECSRREENLKRNQHMYNSIWQQRSMLLQGKSVGEAERYFSEKKELHTNKYEQLRTNKEQLKERNAAVEGAIKQLIDETNKKQQEVNELIVQVNQWVNNNPHQITLEILKDLMTRSHEWVVREKEVLHALKNEKLTSEITLRERQKNLEKQKESDDRPAEGQQKETLTQQLVETEKKREELNTVLTQITVAFSKHNEGKERINAFAKELGDKTVLSENWKKLNMLLGSADGTKFKTIAQGYTLDVLLGYANKHLETLSKRYELEKIPDSLALQVIDNDMLGEIRTVHSLSGGESFLISLSLALGLSSLSSKQMKIESLFIDEGFGSLDLDTLSIAVDALENLQIQGRKIGVISHVAEMMERIAVQIQVKKTIQGKSIIEVIG